MLDLYLYSAIINTPLRCVFTVCVMYVLVGATISLYDTLSQCEKCRQFLLGAVRRPISMAGPSYGSHASLRLLNMGILPMWIFKVHSKLMIIDKLTVTSLNGTRRWTSSGMRSSHCVALFLHCILASHSSWVIFHLNIPFTGHVMYILYIL